MAREDEVDVAALARERLIEAEVLPLLLGLYRARALAGCLAVLVVLFGMVAIPAAVTAVLFVFPALAAGWLRFLGLVLAMVLATAALVAAAGRARRALVDRSVSRRLRRYNEAEASHVRGLIAALGRPGGDAEDGEVAFLRGEARGVVRLSYLAEYRAPFGFRRPAKGGARELVTSRLIGLALWAHDGAEARRLASFVAAASGEAELDAEAHLERFAELPADDLARALGEHLALPLVDRSTLYRLP